MSITKKIIEMEQTNTDLINKLCVLYNRGEIDNPISQGIMRQMIKNIKKPLSHKQHFYYEKDIEPLLTKCVECKACCESFYVENASKNIGDFYWCCELCFENSFHYFH